MGSADLAQAMSEGINCLAIFLCGPALRRCGEDAKDLLGQFAGEYAATFRRLGPSLGAKQAAYQIALDRVLSVATTGVDLQAAKDVAALRRTIRELFVALGLPLPAVPPDEAAICELHGASCPVRAGGA